MKERTYTIRYRSVPEYVNPKINEESLDSHYDSHYIKKNTRYVQMPYSILSELIEFSQRNCLIVKHHKNGEEKIERKVCMSCLKAHALKKANEKGLPQNEINDLSRIFKCKTGHSGYYMDGNDVIEI